MKTAILVLLLAGWPALAEAPSNFLPVHSERDFHRALDETSDWYLAVVWLKTLSDAAAGLHNGPSPIWNAVVHAWDEFTHEPRVTVFKLSRGVVVPLVRALDWRDVRGELELFSANNSAAGFQALFSEVAYCLKDRARELQANDDAQGFGWRVMTPKTQDILDFVSTRQY
jgi:hypothetical protein